MYQNLRHAFIQMENGICLQTTIHVRRPLLKNGVTLKNNKTVYLSMTNKENRVCNHENTYVAVRHVGGIKLVKCSDCNCTVYCG